MLYSLLNRFRLFIFERQRYVKNDKSLKQKWISSFFILIWFYFRFADFFFGKAAHQKDLIMQLPASWWNQAVTSGLLCALFLCFLRTSSFAHHASYCCGIGAKTWLILPWSNSSYISKRPLDLRERQKLFKSKVSLLLDTPKGPEQKGFCEKSFLLSTLTGCNFFVCLLKRDCVFGI